MKIAIITLFPKMIAGFFAESIVGRAQQKGLVTIDIINLRDFAVDAYGSVDDKPYGGGAGMVLRVEPVYEAINKAKGKVKGEERIVLTSPRGKVFHQKKAREFSQLDHLILIAGHYEGVDERVLHYVDEEISLGDFVLTGGEIAAAAIVDAVIRLLPGVLHKEETAAEESFFEVPLETLRQAIGNDPTINKLLKRGTSSVKLLEYPHYTRPATFHRLSVPEVLLSGNPIKINQWRLKKAFEETCTRRRDLLE